MSSDVRPVVSPPSPAPRARPAAATAIGADLPHHGAMRPPRKPFASAWRGTRRAAAALVAVALLAAACDTGAPAGTPPITPGTSSTPREVNIVTRDYAFVPSVVDLAPGETVLLHVVNFGLEEHEAVFGTLDASSPGRPPRRRPSAHPPGPTPFVAAARAASTGIRVVVGSGQRVDVTWTVPADAARRGRRLVRRLPHPGSLAEGHGRARPVGRPRRRAPGHARRRCRRSAPPPAESPVGCAGGRRIAARRPSPAAAACAVVRSCGASRSREAREPRTLRESLRIMAYVIAEPCIDVLDESCVSVCPVDCIHFDAGTDRMLSIDPNECIDCGACEPECPVNAIFPEESLPPEWAQYTQINAVWFTDKAAARARGRRRSSPPDPPDAASEPSEAPATAAATAPTLAACASSPSSPPRPRSCSRSGWATSSSASARTATTRPTSGTSRSSAAGPRTCRARPPREINAAVEAVDARSHGAVRARRRGARGGRART